MTASVGSKLIGRWRIVEADLWDRQGKRVKKCVTKC